MRWPAGAAQGQSAKVAMMGEYRLIMAGSVRRVFLSHTSELRDFPAGRSFVGAAEAAVKRVSDAVTDMEYFSAADDKPSDYCQELVRGCDVYIGLIGLRYGSLVLDRPDVSYTELEFDTATEAGLTRLIFMLDENAAVPIPPAHLIDEPELQVRQRNFRAKLLNAGLTIGTFSSPEGLETEVLQALQRLPPPAPAGQVARLPVSLPLRPPMLADREGLLVELHSLLTSGNQPRVVVLAGMGGVGKTSLATEYAHRHLDLAEVGVAWQVPADDAVSLSAGLAELAAQIGGQEVGDARDPVASVHAMLAAYPAEWLLVFDNAPDPGSVRRFLPPTGRGRILITSQSQHWPGARVLDVPVLAPGAAARFLVDRTGEPDDSSAEALAVELGGLPLALEQAAAYMKAATTTLASYLALYRQRRRDLLTRGEVPDHPDSVDMTLALALTRIKRDAPDAAGLLQLLASLAPEPVPLTLLLSSPEAAATISGDPRAILSRLAGDSLAIGDAMTALRHYSIVSVTYGTVPTVLVHRLVINAILDQMTAQVAQQWRQAAAIIVASAIPVDIRLPDAWPICAVLLLHAQAALDDMNVGMQHLATYAGYSGDYNGARDLWQRIAAAHKDDLGDEHPDTLAARGHLAYWTGEAGDPVAARDQFGALLPLMKQVDGVDDPATLTIANHLAMYLAKLGEIETARDLDQDTLDRRRRTLGEDHPDTLTSASNLAADLSQLRHGEQARDLATDTLGRRRIVLGEYHPDTLRTASLLATILGELGENEHARNLAEDILDARRRNLGEDHPDTLITAVNLAEILHKAGETQAARDLAEDTVPRLRGRLGENHPYTQAAAANLDDYRAS